MWTTEILDATLRETCLKGSEFSDRQAADVVRRLDEAGIDWIEVGYLDPGRWHERPGAASCAPRYLRRLRKAAARSRLAVFAHAGRVSVADYRRLSDLGGDMVRFALTAGPAWSETSARLREHVAAAREAGLRVSLNAIRTSQLERHEVLHRARLADELGADVFCIADSNGSLLPARLQSLAADLQRGFGRTLGFHGHDHLTLAFANALVAIDNGFRLIDATLGGSGKGGGNLRTELLAGRLNLEHGRDYDLRGLVAAAEQWSTLAAPTVAEDPFQQTAYGLLDLNLDQIRELTEHAAASGRTVTEVLHEALRTKRPRHTAA